MVDQASRSAWRKFGRLDASLRNVRNRPDQAVGIPQLGQRSLSADSLKLHRHVRHFRCFISSS